MKSSTLLLAFISVLSCRAETTTPAASERPAPSPKPELTVQNSSIIVAPLVVVAATPEKMKSAAPDLKKELSMAFAQQQADMAKQFAQDNQNQKATLAGFLAIEKPAMIAPNAGNAAPGKRTNAIATTEKTSELKPVMDAKALALQPQQSAPQAPAAAIAVAPAGEKVK
jgi:hypothetical protein